MKAVLLLSGGLDSAVALWHLRTSGWDVLPFAVDYGQRHVRELEAARAIAGAAGVTLMVAHLPQLRTVFGNSNSQTGVIAVPEGHYAAPTMAQTVVPNRNMVLLSLATAYAVASGAATVAYAAHTGDHPIYPDCRHGFVEAMKGALFLCHDKPIALLAPFLTMDKAAVVRLGHSLGVPFGLTWSCYAGGLRHCGRCGTCVERREAFTLAGVADPTEYER